MIVLNPLQKRRSAKSSGVTRKKRTPRPMRKKRVAYRSPAVGATVRTRSRKTPKRGGGFSRLHRAPSGKFSVYPFDRSVIARKCSLKKRGGWQMHRSKAEKFSTGGRLIGCFKNPTASIVKSATAGFQPNEIMHALPIAVGVLLNQQAAALVGNWTGWNEGFKGAAVGIGSAGAALMIPKYGPRLFLGGLVRVMIGAALPYVEKWFGDATPAPVVPAVAAPAAPVAAASAAPAATATMSSLKDSGSHGGTSFNPEDGAEYDGSLDTGKQWNEGMSDLPIVDGDAE